MWNEPPSANEHMNIEDRWQGNSRTTQSTLLLVCRLKTWKFRELPKVFLLLFLLCVFFVKMCVKEAAIDTHFNFPKELAVVMSIWITCVSKTHSGEVNKLLLHLGTVVLGLLSFGSLGLAIMQKNNGSSEQHWGKWIRTVVWELLWGYSSV